MEDTTSKNDQKKLALNPMNWVLGSEFVVAVVVLTLASFGYVIFK